MKIKNIVEERNTIFNSFENFEHKIPEYVIDDVLENGAAFITVDTIRDFIQLAAKVSHYKNVFVQNILKTIIIIYRMIKSNHRCFK